MQLPLASVIIPAYNAERFLRQAVESALAQTYPRVEVIVVNDGSTDGTQKLAEELARNDGRVKVFTQENAGVGAARNRGITEAQGAYIAPLDADDFWYPEKLTRQIASLEERGENWGLAYCWSRSVNEDGVITDSLPHWPVEGDIFQALIYRNIIGNASVPLFRASALRDVGVFRTRAEQGGAQGCEDWDLTLRVAAKHLAVGIPEHLVAYRQISGTMTSNFLGMARSYENTVGELRANHPELPKFLLRWSAGHFYMYMLNVCYAIGNYPACFGMLARLLSADPAMLLSPTIYRVAVMSLFRLVAGRDFLRRDRHEPPGDGLRKALWVPSHWIEARRWAVLQQKKDPL
jgi:glycosyltransferase involved in cell wall biosynthesis